MKRIILGCLILFGVLICCTNCNNNKTFTKRNYIHNISEETITLVCPHFPSTYRYDSIFLKSNEYYLFEESECVDGDVVNINLNYDYPLYIYYHDTCFQVDRNDENCCLWERAYRYSTAQEDSLFAEKENDYIRIFDMTTEKIHAGIRK